jgi:steroid delta-isomerase-like uncharacterized protein
MATDNIAIARRFIEEVWNKGNFAVIGELVADNHIAHDPLAGEVQGASGLQQLIKSYREAFPDVTFTIEDIGMAGDRVFHRWTARGTHRGSLMGIPPTNKAGEIRGISVDRFAGGKMVEHHASFDTLGLLQLVGAVPAREQLMRGGAQRAPSPQA